MEQTNVFISRAKEIKGKAISYTMTRGMYNAYFEKGQPRSPQVVIDDINSTFGLLGTVTELHIEG